MAFPTYFSVQNLLQPRYRFAVTQPPTNAHPLSGNSIPPLSHGPQPASRWQTVIGLIVFVWCLTITVRFIRVLIRQSATPFNAGADWLWTTGWIIACGLVLIAFAVFPAFLKKVMLLIPVSAGAILLTLSGRWTAAVLAMWLLLLCASLGLAVLYRLTGKAELRVDVAACAIPIGAGVISIGVLALGLLHLLTIPMIYVSLSLVSLWGLRFFYRNVALSQAVGAVQRFLSSADHLLLCTIMASIAAVYLVSALAPEIDYDALNYHLAIPAVYLRDAGVHEVPFFHAYFARTIELFLTTCLAVGGAATAKMCVFFMSLWAAFTVFALGYYAFDERVGVYAAVLFLTTPLVGWASGTVYTDNIVAMLVTSSFIAFVRWADSRQPGWLYAGAMIAGIAVGSKVNVAFAYVLLGPIIVSLVFLSRQANWRERFGTLTLATLAGGLFALPTYLLVYRFTGNPVFPLFNGIFKSPKWFLDNSIMNASQFGMPMTLSSLIRFPFRLTLDTIRFGEAVARGSVGIALLFALPFGLVLLRRSRLAPRLLFVACMGYIVALFYTMQYARYYLSVLPAVIVIGVATILYLVPRPVSRWAHSLFLLLIVLQPLVYSLNLGSLPERLPIGLALGKETEDAFLRRALPGYAAAMYLNEVTSPADRILGVGTENVRFYLRAELQTYALSLVTDPVRNLVLMPPDEKLATSMKAIGITHLFVNREAAKEIPGVPYLEHTFLKSHARCVFEDESVMVYRIL